MVLGTCDGCFACRSFSTAEQLGPRKKHAFARALLHGKVVETCCAACAVALGALLFAGAGPTKGARIMSDPIVYTQCFCVR